MLFIWIAFLALIAAMLALDLGVFHRRAHAIHVKEALGWSAMWITVGLLFTGAIYLLYEHHTLGIGTATDYVTGAASNGRDASLKYITGYLIEKSLSVDNIFVFALLFSALAIPAAYQHRVLYWGIFGALLLRGMMIGVGAELIGRYHWIVYLLGASLLLTAVKMLVMPAQPGNYQDSAVARLVQKWLPVTAEFHGTEFVVRDPLHRRWMLTPLAVGLVVVETTDVAFAVDSIPAIFAITGDPFLVFTSNVFALLGLRSLYFAVAGIIEKFRYLRVSLSVILAVVGTKMLLAGHLEKLMGENFNLYLLGLILLILCVGVVCSMLVDRRHPLAPRAPAAKEVSHEDLDRLRRIRMG